MKLPLRLRSRLRAAALTFGAALSVVVLASCATTTPAPASNGDEQRLDTLRVGVAILPSTLDPTINPGNASVAVQYNIFDTLIHADEKNDYALEASIATEWERVDDQTLDVTIDTSITFHDGEALEAEDIQFTFDRMKEDITGIELARGLMSTIESVEILNESQIRIHATGPDPILEQRVSSIWGSWIISKDYYEKVGPEEFAQKPTGTGPYAVEKFSPEGLVLTRYEGFHGEAPAVDRIEFVLIPEAAPRITALLSGDVDIITQIPPDQVDTVTGNNVETISTPIQNMHLLTFNTAAPGMDDPLLRQALSLGIDRQLLIDSLWNGMSSIPKGHQYEQYGDLFTDDYPEYAYDPDRARELVEESTYNGEELRYVINPNYYTNSSDAAQAIVSMWKEIGVNATVEFLEDPNAEVEAAVIPWSNSMRFPDPLGGLWLLWGDRAAGGDETAAWNDPEFVEIGERLATTMDADERKDVAQELMKRWDQQVPAFPLYTPVETWGVRAGLNWEPNASYVMDFRADGFSVE